MARKRKNAKRTKSGRISRAGARPLYDRGTPELQAKRVALVGSESDPVLAATVPGILHAHGYIDSRQYAKALEFRVLRHALYGPPWPVKADVTPISERRFAALTTRFNAMLRVLPIQTRETVSDVCAFDRIPTWFFVKRLGLVEQPDDILQNKLLLSGLDALVSGIPAAGIFFAPRLTQTPVFW